MNRKYSLLSILIILALSLSACGKKSPLHVYEYGGNDDSLVFDYTGDKYIIENMMAYENSQAPRSRMFEFMGTEYELEYDKTESKEFLPYAEDVYYAKNNHEIIVSFLENTDKVTEATFWEGLTIELLNHIADEDDYRQIADSILEDYINLEDYTCTSSTLVYHFDEENGTATGSYKNYDFFYQGYDPAGFTKYAMLGIFKSNGVNIHFASDAHRPEDVGANILVMQSCLM